MTAPPVVVLRSEPEVMLEMAKLVVVACVPVALTKVKFWRVVEEVTRRFVVVAWPKMVSPPPCVPFPIVVLASDMMPFVKPTNVEVETPYEVTVNGKSLPLPDVMQVPSTAKQPSARSMPFVKVEVAPPDWLMAKTLMPPAKVEVAEEVAVMYPTVGLEAAARLSESVQYAKRFVEP